AVPSYAYAVNNPLGYSDPTGFAIEMPTTDQRIQDFMPDCADGDFMACLGGWILDTVGGPNQFDIIPTPLASIESGICRAVARTEAANLAEQLTLKEAEAGAGKRIMQGRIKDVLFPEADWAKMQHVHMTPEGQNIVIHYWERLRDGFRTGFKFK